MAAILEINISTVTLGKSKQGPRIPYPNHGIHDGEPCNVQRLQQVQSGACWPSAEHQRQVNAGQETNLQHSTAHLW